jgi:hypothetical protein
LSLLSFLSDYFNKLYENQIVKYYFFYSGVQRFSFERFLEFNALALGVWSSTLSLWRCRSGVQRFSFGRLLEFIFKAKALDSKKTQS